MSIGRKLLVVKVIFIVITFTLICPTYSSIEKEFQFVSEIKQPLERLDYKEIKDYLVLRILMKCLMQLLTRQSRWSLYDVFPSNVLHLLSTCRRLPETSNLSLVNRLNPSWWSVMRHVKLSTLTR